MIVFDSLEAFDRDAFGRPRALTAGVFDGVHVAHRRLLARTVEIARGDEARGTAIVFTFANHPLSILAPPYHPKLLLSRERKIELIERAGIDALVIQEFSRDLASLAPETFIDEVLASRLGVDRLIVGFDFRFGESGRGDAAMLEARAPDRGFAVETIPAVLHEDWAIGSTRIRELVEEGRVRLASELLGRPHELEGRVVRGFGRGAQLGFPTANIEFDPRFAMPPSGVYAVYVSDGDKVHGGMMNIGSSPTFAGAVYRHEAFLFDFQGEDLYGRTLRVHFVDRMREERKFASEQELTERLRVDEKIARAILESHPARWDEGA
ncbi:riboflavin biosynthesis protein RibF [Candidatus Sumerlaeota bacterium]|nr:riboflavin biosynthesis protein RibF [Candidatus Sumerlaeota bacterium]